MSQISFERALLIGQRTTHAMAASHSQVSPSFITNELLEWVNLINNLMPYVLLQAFLSSRFDQVRLKPTCAAIEANYRLQISDIETRDIILSKQRKTKVLIRLRGCADWFAPLLFAYCINRFSHDVAQFQFTILKWWIEIKTPYFPTEWKTATGRQGFRNFPGWYFRNSGYFP